MKTIKEILQKMDFQSLEQAPQELMPYENGGSENLISAMSGKLISQISKEEINSALRYAMLKVGIRAKNLPGEEESQILLSHVVNNYGNITADEIRIAFDLAITEKLDIEDANCYENFSCLYICKILNSYKRWKSKQIEPMMKASQKEESLIKDKVHWGGVINSIYGKLKEGKFVPYETFPTECYDQMVFDGLIDGQSLVSDKEKKKIVLLALQNALEMNKPCIYVR